MKKVVLISSCMLGIPCDYRGKGAKRCLTAEEIKKLNCTLIPVCPEQIGGLNTPRPAAEIQGGDGFDVLEGRAKVVTVEGRDVTREYIQGAEHTLRIAQISGATMMIVKRKSPSCSCAKIYDGTFSRTLTQGMGVTSALITRKTDIQLVDLDMLEAVDMDLDVFRKKPGSVETANTIHQTLKAIFEIYQAKAGWDERQQKSTALIKNARLETLPDLEMTLQREFRQFLPVACTGVSDSDTVRFFREAFKQTLQLELLDANRHCRICTYPEGFLDSYIGEEGICSACRTYQTNKAILEDRENLRKILQEKLSEATSFGQYSAALAFSGGKDSVYTLTRLRSYYNAKVLCVMDDLNQQTEQAMRNAEKAVKLTGADFCLLPAPGPERDIRRNFIKAGESFCRLCLRSHFIRVYQVALEKRIPLVFFGFSPHQCLDCENAIAWSLNSIKEVSTPFAQLDPKSVLARNKQRAFQGGFDRGFVSDEEKLLLKEWTEIFDHAPANFAPLVVPFFVFDGYPDEETLINTISHDVEWERPETLLLHRSNCRWLPPAGLFHQAVGKYHLNYKERATALRFQGQIISEAEATQLFHALNTGHADETMTQETFEQFLNTDFGFQLTDIPEPIRTNLQSLLKRDQ